MVLGLHLLVRHRLLRGWLFLLTTPILLSGCAEDLSAVHPAGPAAEVIARLWWVMLAGATAIFLFVTGLLALAMRRRPGGGSDRLWLQGLGLAFPLTVLAALLAYGLTVGEALLPHDHPERVTVRAEARQWAWRFGYEDRPGLQTEDILHIPAGRPVDVQITSADVIHSFWVPRLAGKMDAIPGHVNLLRIEARVPGDYAGVSAEFSGPGYRTHAFTVRAHDAADWQAFLEAPSP
ncbi:cytochrome B [Rhodobacter sphaeroides]|uniref:cytochrome c oxidase subunit II n=1 Tax=Cereibacter sphaeroides TaxID=1063 RepID=UPI0004A874CA|nr:cytochrome b561 [Cereibacter sphaeroides]AMJ49718.1 cytochrome B [Cereibacter sphaeroides]ANS36432.1 cytochrome B [Cereibacter sphaeroides]ATN65490.1 cytochrome B [Cereibacter sphaeroides]AXC63714.1 cytochrome B [Cereibacter sphaeroides 2.4.1]MVX49880.1 cytochrome B [Cereibacter sphaeroides]